MLYALFEKKYIKSKSTKLKAAFVFQYFYLIFFSQVTEKKELTKIIGIVFFEINFSSRLIMISISLVKKCLNHLS